MPMRSRSKEWNDLKNGQTIEFQGFILQGLPKEDIKEGDYYVAERNAGPVFLQAREVSLIHNCIHPNSPSYSFDI